MPGNRIIWSLAALLAAVVLVVVFVVRAGGAERGAPTPAGAVPVTTARIVARTVPFRLRAIGNVVPYTTVAVKALVDGQIVAARFKQGDAVAKGALLFEIDPRPFQAALAQAQANLARDKALLERARQQQARDHDLVQKKFLSPDAYDQAKTNTDTAAATVSADQAAIETARLNLADCSIRSPIDGYAGQITIQPGNLVKANDTNALVVINQVVPIYTAFSVPEQYLSEIRAHQASGDLQVQATLGKAPNPASGRLVFIDNSADVTTGTIRLQAEFANVDKAFWPGQFVDVALTLYEQQGAVVAPSIAVQNGPNGQYVFVVGPQDKVDLRPVKIARTEGDDAVVESGLEPGEQVVTLGQIRLAPGVQVKVDNQVKAGNPPDSR